MEEDYKPFLEHMSEEKVEVVNLLVSLGWEPKRFKGKNPHWEFIHKEQDTRITIPQGKMTYSWVARMAIVHHRRFVPLVIAALRFFVANKDNVK